MRNIYLVEAKKTDKIDELPMGMDKNAQFHTTHWSVVLAAGQDANPYAMTALEQLCHTYWYPLYAHVRRRGYGIDDAQDLTQEFFSRLLAKRWLGMADQNRGRFRSFLLSSLNHFLANEWDNAHRAKRQGAYSHVSFDLSDGERLYQLEPSNELGPDEIYERAWALRLLDSVRNRLRGEYSRSGKTGRFDILESFLPGEESAMTYEQAAVHLGVPEGTLKSDVHRLKRRYGDLLREQILHTLEASSDVEEELRHLVHVLGR